MQDNFIMFALQLSEEKVVATLYPTRVAIIDNWTLVRLIEDVNPGNEDKFWLAPMPYWHLSHLPFVISGGMTSFNLINVNNARMEPLIIG